MPGPETVLQAEVSVPPDGMVVSVTVPSSCAVAGGVAGIVMVWFGPASTAGGWFVAPPMGGRGALISYILPSFSDGSELLSTPRSTT